MQAAFLMIVSEFTSVNVERVQRHAACIFDDSERVYERQRGRRRGLRAVLKLVAVGVEPVLNELPILLEAAK